VDFVPASARSVLAFEAVLSAVGAMVLAAIHFSSLRLGAPAVRRTSRAALALAAWLGGCALVVGSGVLSTHPMPALPLYMAVNNLVALGLGLSAVGGWLSRGLPLAALVAFQGFRLPLELVLHDWARQGTIPETMTYSGQNLDILSGLCALVAAPLASRSRAAAWIANLVGCALLANVARVAILSSPLPFAWAVTPRLRLAEHLPYALIVPLAVSAALFGHVVLTRALLSRPATGATSGARSATPA
jgi:hypothetical protein